jgi:hypothetical protein
MNFHSSRTASASEGDIALMKTIVGQNLRGEMTCVLYVKIPQEADRDNFELLGQNNLSLPFDFSRKFPADPPIVHFLLR